MLRVLGWVVALVLAVLTILGVIVDGLGLATRAPFAHVIAFRGVLGAASVALAVLLAVVAAPGPRGARPGGAAAFLAAALFVTGGVHVGTVVARGVSNDPPLTPDTDGASLTVLAINTLDGAASPEAVADVAASVDAGVVALPETPIDMARGIAELLAAEGMPMQVFADDHGFRHRATSLLVAESLGRYAQVESAAGPASVHLESVDGSGPPLIAVHVPRPGRRATGEWLESLEAAVRACRETAGAVVLGDFNATLDHGPMRSLRPCLDAAAAGGLDGAGAYGTWHTALPALLGAPIDHVLADGRQWRVVEAGVRNVGESDHRGVVARLEPRAER